MPKWRTAPLQSARSWRTAPVGGKGSSPQTPIDKQHPDLPDSTRRKLKNLAEGVSPEVMVRELKKLGFDVYPTEDHYAIRKPGETEWHVVDPGEWGWAETFKDITDYGTDLIKDLGWTGGAFVGGVAGAAATGGPWGGVAGSIPGAGVGSGIAQEFVTNMAQISGIDVAPAEEERAALEQAAIGAGGQAALGAAGKVLGWGGKQIAKGYRKIRGLSKPLPPGWKPRPAIWEQPLPEGAKPGKSVFNRSIPSPLAAEEAAREAGFVFKDGRWVRPKPKKRPSLAGKQGVQQQPPRRLGRPEPLDIPDILKGASARKPLEEMSEQELRALKKQLAARYKEATGPKGGFSKEQADVMSDIVKVNQRLKDLGGSGKQQVGVTKKSSVAVSGKKIAELEAKDAKAGRAGPFYRQFYARLRKGIRVEPQSEVAEKIIKVNSDVKAPFFIEFIKISGEPSGRRKVQAALSVATDKARLKAIDSGLFANMGEGQLRLHAKMWGMPRASADTVSREKLLSFMYGKGDVLPKAPKLPKLSAPYKGIKGQKRSYSPEDYGQRTLIDIDAGHYINFELEGVTKVSGKGGKFTRVKSSGRGVTPRSSVGYEPPPMLGKEPAPGVRPSLQSGTRFAARKGATGAMEDIGEAVYRWNRLTGMGKGPAMMASRLHHSKKLQERVAGESGEGVWGWVGNKARASLGALDRYFTSPDTPPTVRSKLRKLLMSIGTIRFTKLLAGFMKDKVFKDWWQEHRGEIYAGQP